MEEEKNVETVESVETQTTNSTPIQRKGFNITSMILGIIAIVFCFTSYCLYVSLPCSIIAIIFSIAGRKDAGRGMGIAGLVLGLVSLVILVIFIVLAILGVEAAFATVK